MIKVQDVLVDASGQMLLAATKHLDFDHALQEVTTTFLHNSYSGRRLWSVPDNLLLHYLPTGQSSIGLLGLQPAFRCGKSRSSMSCTGRKGGACSNWCGLGILQV